MKSDEHKKRLVKDRLTLRPREVPPERAEEVAQQAVEKADARSDGAEDRGKS